MYRTVVVATFNDFIINQRAAPAEQQSRERENFPKTFHVGSKQRKRESEREISFSLFRAREGKIGWNSSFTSSLYTFMIRIRRKA